MRRNRRLKWAALTAVVAAGMALLLAGPVFGSGHPDADRLRLTDDVEMFFYGGLHPTDPGVTQQGLPLGKKGCEIGSLSGPLVTLGSGSSGGGGVKDPGLFNQAMGVKSGGSNGTPCSETSGPERLIIESQFSWIRLELDVQPKGNAWIHVELFDGPTMVAHHQLLTGASIEDYNDANDPDETPADTTIPYEATTTGSDQIEACANPSDSGPDSGPNDNCRWFIQPGVNFDKVVLYTSVGSVALEGGNDFASFDPTGFGNGDYDSLFYRALDVTDDAYATDEDTELNVAAPGVRSNDSTVVSAVSAVEVTGPSHGTLTLNADGSFDYVPDLNFFGTDGFSYHLTDGVETSDTANVVITVNSVNDAPVAKTAPPPLTAIEDTGKTYDGDDLATDADGDPIVVTVASAVGTTTIEDGEVLYTPPENVCGPAADTLTFTVSDENGGFASGSLPIDITCVNDPPETNSDSMADSYSIDERVYQPVPMTFAANIFTDPAPGVLGNDTDPDGDTLTIQSNTPPQSATAPAAGSLTVNNMTGEFTYTPTVLTEQQWTDLGAFSYDVTWMYTVSDGNGGTDTATVTITVNRVVCSGETVSDADTHGTLGYTVSGSFTLLTGGNICKRYSVVAYSGDGIDPEPSVTFDSEPNDDGGAVEAFRGVMTFDPQPTMDGSFLVGLTYQTDPDDPATERSLLACIAPSFVGGLVVSATLPLTPETTDDPATTETWCLAAGSFIADGNGDYVPTVQVFGEQDPKFTLR